MKHLSVFVALMACGLFANAQIVKVESIKRVNTPVEVDQAVISPDGSKVIVSTLSDASLMSVNLADGKATKVVDNGTLYELKFTDDSKSIFYVQQTIDANKLVYKQVRSHNLVNGKNLQVLAPSREFNGITVRGNNATIVASATPKVVSLENAQKIAAPVPYIYYGQLMIDNGRGQKIALNPQGKEGESYVWPSLSPNGMKVLYYHVGTGAWTCNLDGSNPQRIGDIRAPRWLDNNTIVGMNDEDNGEMFTKSEIIVADTKGKTQSIAVPGIIALYPSVSADAKKITFSTPEGSLYIVNISK